MKSASSLLATTATGLLAMTAGAQAAAPPPPLPVAPLFWTAIADTGDLAPLKRSGFGTVSSFTGFRPPVLVAPNTAAIPQYAFKGRMILPVALDEAVWSNGDPRSWNSPVSYAPFMTAQEGDTVRNSFGTLTLGNGSRMPVRALQTNFPGGTLFTTTSSVNANVNLSIYDDGDPGPLLRALAGRNVQQPVTTPPSLPPSGTIFGDGGLAVTSSSRLAEWTQIPGMTGTLAWDLFPVPPVPQNLLGNIIRWTAPAPPPNINPKVPCSPAISEYGAVAHRGRVIAPWWRRNVIMAEPLSPSGLFPANTLVVQENDPASLAERFGTFHPNLMAIAGGPNVNPTVAWQMSNMRGNPPNTNRPGPVLPGTRSLWCWMHLSPSGTNYAQIARIGIAAPFLLGPPKFFTSFYALHLVDDHLNWRESDVFFGATITGGYHVIYKRHIRDSAGVTLGPYDLIATDEPLTASSVPVPSILGGTVAIKALFPWFSVDTSGNVLMKASITATPGLTECLITARPPFHAMQMCAQSGVGFIPKSGPVETIKNFAITNPEQGPLGRGQGISGPHVGARIDYSGGSTIAVGQ